MSESKSYSLDTWENKALVIMVKQGDSDRTIPFTLNTNGAPYDLTNKSVQFYIEKPDGHLIFNDCTIVDPLLGTIKVFLTEQCTILDGTLKMEITICGAVGRESTYTLYLMCMPTVIDNDAVISSSEYLAFTSRLDDIDQALQNINLLTSVLELVQNQINIGNQLHIDLMNDISELGELRIAIEQAIINALTVIGEMEALKVWEDFNFYKQYVPLNKVSYQGSSYCNILACTEVLPTNTTNWLLISAKGDVGPIGLQGEPGIPGTDKKVLNFHFYYSTLGAEKLVMMFPFDATIISCNALCLFEGVQDTELIIEKTSETAYRNKLNTWTPVLSSNLKILAGQVMDDGSYVIGNAVTNENDVFRIRMVEETDIQELNVQIEFLI